MPQDSGTPKRNLKRCCLTNQGAKQLKSALDRMEKEQRSDSAIAAGCGCHRDTVGKVLNRSGSATFSSIERLFIYVGLDIQEEHWQEWNGAVASPAVQNKKQPTQPSKPDPNRSQQVAELLWTLNCNEQVNEFKKASGLGNPAQAFAVQASEVSIQKWLVKRLTRDRESAAKYPFGVAAHPMRWKFEAFWEDFARRLHLPTAEPEEVLQRLCEQSQTKPIMIAAYGLNTLPDVRDQLLQEFWKPLSARYCAQPPKSFRSRLYLFLSDELVGEDGLNHCPNVCLLPKLTEISVNDVKEWIARDEVYSLLSQLIQEEAIETEVSKRLPLWRTQPSQVIDHVCDLFQLEHGRVEIERFWELAG